MSSTPTRQNAPTPLRPLAAPAPSAASMPHDTGEVLESLADLRPPIVHVDRSTAAAAYVGAVGLLSWAVMPETQFAQRHNRLAVLAHLLRFFWVGGLLTLWWLDAAHGPARQRFGKLAVDLGMLLLAGIPWPATFTAGPLPWLLAPLAVCWFLSIAGFVLAVTGRTADLYACTHADWTDAALSRRWLWRSPEEQRKAARLARERQIERLQRTHQAVSAERVRRDRISEAQEELEQLQAQRRHNDHLLASGELSRKRYATLNGELDAEIAALREQMAELSSRVVMRSNAIPERLRVSRLDRASDSRANTVAFVNRSGVPIFTYGHFQLDEALVAGMLSAFDSLTEEVFGSRVHKTELAEGQVMHFLHGQHIIVVAIFEEEPSPRQIEQLRTMLQQFEHANAGPLAREQYDQRFLHEVQIPFRFRDRLGSGE
jgi:hypothetical protein